jgi:hypothetical protein
MGQINDQAKIGEANKTKILFLFSIKIFKQKKKIVQILFIQKFGENTTMIVLFLFIFVFFFSNSYLIGFQVLKF